MCITELGMTRQFHPSCTACRRFANLPGWLNIYIGNQATLFSGCVMSFGYSVVITEDTVTLLDVATPILTELCDVYTQMMKILRNLQRDSQEIDWFDV